MNDQNDQPIDFSEFDPTRDPARFESLVDGVMRGAAHELAARRTANNIVGQLARWRTPVFSAAAAAVAFLIVSMNGGASQNSSTETDSGIAEAIGIPTEFAAWIRGDTELSVADIYVGLSGQ